MILEFSSVLKETELLAIFVHQKDGDEDFKQRIELYSIHDYTQTL